MNQSVFPSSYAPLLLLMVEIITVTCIKIPVTQSRTSSNGLLQTFLRRKHNDTTIYFHPKHAPEAITRKAASLTSSSASCKPAMCRNSDNVKISCAGNFNRCSHATKYNSPLINCDSNGNNISFNLFLTTDTFGGETYFTLNSSISGATDQIGPREFPDQSSFHISSCLPPDSCYNFTIADLSRDGMCCNGDSPSDKYSGYELIVDGNTIAAGGAFQSSESHFFGACSSSTSTTTRPPTKAPTNKVTEKPTTRAPVTNFPTTKMPITFKPTRKPSTQKPKSLKPSLKPTSNPSTKHPNSARPTITHTTKQPISLTPTTMEPSTQPPKSLKPTIQPSTKQPVSTKPTAIPSAKLSTIVPTTMKPSTQQPKNVKPTIQPSTKQPVSTRPTAIPSAKLSTIVPTTMKPSTQQPKSLKPTTQTSTKQPVSTRPTAIPSAKQSIIVPNNMKPSGILGEEITTDKPTMEASLAKSPTNLPTRKYTSNKKPVTSNALSGKKTNMYCPWDIPIVIASSENDNNQTQIAGAEILFQYYIVLPSTQTNATPVSIQSDVLPSLKRALLMSLKSDCSKLNNNTYLLRRVLESYNNVIAVGAFPADEVIKNATCPKKNINEENQCFVIQGKVTVFSSPNLDVGWAQKSFITYANETMTIGLAGIYGNFAITEIQMMDAGPTTILQQENEATRPRPALISLAILGASLLILITIVSVHYDWKKKKLSKDGVQSADGLQKPIDNSKCVNDICIPNDDSNLNNVLDCTKVIQQRNLIDCQEAIEGNGFEVSMTAEAEAALSTLGDRENNSATDTINSTSTGEKIDFRSRIQNSRVVLSNALMLRKKKIENDDSSLLASTKKRPRDGVLASFFHRNEGSLSRSPSYDFSDAKSNTSSTVEEDQLQHCCQPPSLKKSRFRTYNRPLVGATPLCYEVGDEIHEYNSDTMEGQREKANGGKSKDQKKRVSWAKNVVISRISPPTTSSSPESAPITHSKQKETTYSEEKSEGFSSFNFNPPSCDLSEATNFSNVRHNSGSRSNMHDLPGKKSYQVESENHRIIFRASTDNSSISEDSYSGSDIRQKTAVNIPEHSNYISNTTRGIKRRIKMHSLFPLLSSLKTKSTHQRENDLPQRMSNDGAEKNKTLPIIPNEMGTANSNLISSRRHNEDGFSTFVFESNAKSKVTENILL